MFEVKPISMEKDSSNGPDGGGVDRGPRAVHFESPGMGCESLYLYDSQDWVVTPSGSPEEAGTISPMLAEETLRYMILSGNRVEHMTKSFNDIDVVTHLLTERDRDLELAARIGQSLLQRNHVLQERNDAVEEQLAQALDQVHQLQHELGKKDELLRMVASASEESETDSSCSTPLRHALSTPLHLGHLEALQSKLQELEEENLTLRSEACHLKKETVTYEEKEQKLVSDCVKELRESNSQMVTLTEELSHKNEELLRHQEEIAQLLSQIVELQHRVKELALEKEELRVHLQASKDAQRQLTEELKELQDRNAECMGMLQESQEEIRELRNKSAPSAGMRRHLPYGLLPLDSIAAEIEGTMRRELSVEEERSVQDQRSTQKRVFQTVRSINESVCAHPTPAPIPGSGRSSVVMTAQPFLSSLRSVDTSCGAKDPTESTGEGPQTGPPGSPSGSDLASALHRLSLRRQNFLCERQFIEAERGRKPQALDPEGPGEDSSRSGCGSLDGSIVSSVTSLSDFSAASVCFRTFLPEKLQIVKPMEGSLTLHHWQQLAQPHLATILDPHPGVVTKGFRPLPQDTVYHLADLEEDGDEEQGSFRGVRERYKSKRQEEEKRKLDEEEEEEEGGITFQVQCSSTPEEKRRKSERPFALSPVHPPSTPHHMSPAVPEASILSGLPAPHAPVHSKRQIPSMPAPSSAHNPGKCLSSTFSTYTFTTCRILHPCDVTQVTSSSLGGPAVSVRENIPSSLRPGPSTPVTPCRLSLGDSFPPRHRAAPRGLAKLLLEKGISAQVNTRGGLPKPRPSLLPITPPNSPCPSTPCSPVTFETHPSSSDNFLASRPAEFFLQDVYGLKPGRARPHLPSPNAEAPGGASVSLVERLRRLGLTEVLQAADPEGLRRQESATILATGRGSLLDGLRRNHSLPAMIGGRGPPVSSPSHLQPLPHPTTLTLPVTPWGNLKDPSTTHPSCSPVEISTSRP
uniref:Trafficking kinesin protein 2 n=1 Tax=Scleropages formosus TaxID=113540 RepID=A0A8C9R0Q9_SCLFO